MAHHLMITHIYDGNHGVRDKPDSHVICLFDCDWYGIEFVGLSLRYRERDGGPRVCCDHPRALNDIVRGVKIPEHIRAEMCDAVMAAFELKTMKAVPLAR